MTHNNFKWKSMFVIFLYSLLFLNTTNAIEINKHNKLFPDDSEKVFVFHAPINDLNEFRILAEQAARLKPFGRVEINISTLAEKGFHEIPEGRNFWYEYASNNPTPFKFFPDEKIAPFILSEFVKKNRELILKKAKILREYGLGGAFWSYEPNFLPEEFFDAYPQMMGARVDHPRRGNYPAFAPCISVKETQKMYKNMVTERLTNVPEIHTFFFKTNDAGSGICWSDWQYSGPNGPTHCKVYSMGERVATLMNTFKEGAARTGQDISIYLTGSMFSDEEKKDIYNHLPDNCYYQSQNSDKVHGINSMIVGSYPVRGLFFPLEMLRNINSIAGSNANTVFINLRASYDRRYERMNATEKLLDLLIGSLESTPVKGQDPELDQLHKFCVDWAGENSANKLFDAFIKLDVANKYKRDSVRGPSVIYWGVSARHITRPLIVAPQLLSVEEEEYFMPYVFNPSEEEARIDFTDIHGNHKTVPSGVITNYVNKLIEVIKLMQEVDNIPENEFVRNMISALKIHTSIFRSIGNFAEAQGIRDHNAKKINMSPHRPDKIPNWEGDPELQKFNAVMRDELDNTVEFIEILENGGMEFICHAENSKYEDSFLLGPDLVDQLKKKRKIMLKHWTDIESYMTTPLK